jgi:hypothetical protein
MGFLRTVDTAATTTVKHEQGDFLTLRSNLSKREMNIVLGSLPAESFEKIGDNEVKFTFREGMGMAEGLFEALVVAWSLDEPPTARAYLALDPEPAAWVDSVLFEHFADVQKKDRAELGKPTTSPSN